MIYLGVVPKVNSCSFIPMSFCESTYWNDSFTLLQGIITEHIENGVIFHVKDVHRGEEDRSEIIIWDGNPIECNGLITSPAANLSPIGQEVILAVPKIDSTTNEWDVVGDYKSPFLYFQINTLRIEEHLIKGLINNIWSGEQQMLLSHFILGIENKKSCAVIVKTNNVSNMSEWVAYPNPSTSFINISNKSKILQNANYRILSPKGLIEARGKINDGIIDVSSISSGIFFLQVHKKSLILHQSKIVISR